MKKITLLILVFALLLPTVAHAAEKDIPIYLDDKKLQFSSKPFITEGTTLVPLRTIFKELGADISFNSKTQTVKATKGNVTIQLILEQDVAFRNGEPIKLSVKPRAISGVTYVPLRFISQSFGCTIKIIGKQIYIYSPLPSNQPSVEDQPSENHNAEQSTTYPANFSIEEIGKLSNRVVYIEVYDEHNQVLGSGSGVVVGSEGNILTNYHVIDGATSARIDFTDQRSYMTSTLVIKDVDRDLALLKIDASMLPAVSLGDSSTLNLGEEVVAIGSPLGFKNTLSSGVVSTTSRIVDGHSFIQISTPIDHGSSGGALFNMKGELIGITTALVESSAAINLAIPSNDVKTFLAKPQSAQVLSIPMPQETSLSPQELQNYLNANYSGITYEGIVLHFTWTVFMSVDNQDYLIGGTMYDGIEWSDWMVYQQSDSTTLPAMIYYLSEQLRESQGIDNTFFTLYVNSYFSFYPSSFPSSSISSEFPGYRLNYNFIHGSMDYSSGYLYYNLTPENSNTVQWIRMK